MCWRSKFLFNALATIPQSMAYREMRFKWLAYVDLASGLVASLATMALAWWGAGVWALVLRDAFGRRGFGTTRCYSFETEWCGPLSRFAVLAITSAMAER